MERGSPQFGAAAQARNPTSQQGVAWSDRRRQGSVRRCCVGGSQLVAEPFGRTGVR